MASTSPNPNTNSTPRQANIVSGHNHQAPIPPARTHSRPNQPPPPPPLPSVPPVPPKRDSSVAISLNDYRHNSDGANSHVISPKQLNSSVPSTTAHLNGFKPGQQAGSEDEGNFISQFNPLFRPIDELPPPGPFMNRPKTYPSQRALQKHSITPRT